MAVIQVVELSPSLIRKIHAEEPLTDDELRELITHEASLLGMTYDEAVAKAKRGDRGRTPLEWDIWALVWMLGERA